MSQVSSQKSPSLMRYNRVQAVLEQEPGFVAKMGTATELVYKPTGEKQLFAPEVIAVTQAIHNAGKDAHKVHKNEIIRFAVQIFKIGQPAAAPAPVTVAPVSPQEPAAAPVVEKAAPVAAPKPVKTVKAVAKPTVKQKLKPAAAPAPAATPEPPVKEEPTKHSAPIVSESREAAVQKAREILNPERPGENTAANNAYISMYSMSLTLLQLVELYDNQPGKERRMKLFDDVAKEFNKFTSIKSAKEAQKA